jgi:uncharacterized protein YceH (UPF0502 family)
LERLDELLERLRGLGWVKNLGRHPGERAERWGQTLAAPAPGSAPSLAASSAAAPMPPATRTGSADLASRVTALEARVASLEKLLAEPGG